MIDIERWGRCSSRRIAFGALVQSAKARPTHAWSSRARRPVSVKTMEKHPLLHVLL